MTGTHYSRPMTNCYHLAWSNGVMEYRWRYESVVADIFDHSEKRDMNEDKKLLVKWCPKNIFMY